MMLFKPVWLIVGAFLLDCVIGDPQNPLHPMRIIGRGISLGVAAYHKMKAKSHAAQFVSGMILTMFIVGFSYAATWFVIGGFYRLNAWLGLAAEIILCYFLIAPKALRDESMKVYRAVIAGDLAGARKNLSFIVGRDTANLGFPAIVRAAVETVAENLSDGVVAPLIFILIGGAPLGMAYKAVNTLDSMIGYRNAEFEYFGKFAARLDDVVNFIPARISAVLMILGSFFIRADVRGAARIYQRDRRNHKSPNSAQTESVCAGALGLRLGGDNCYHGALVRKPAIGDDIREPEPAHIAAANRLMYASVIEAVVLLSAVGAAVAVIWGHAHV